jgi:hypothetical protein
MKKFSIFLILIVLIVTESSQSPNAQRGTMRVRRKSKKQAEDRLQAQEDSLAKAAKDKLKIKKPW